MEEKRSSLEVGTFTFGLCNTIIIFVLSCALWFFVGLKMETVTPGMFGAFLFWGILVIVFLGFNGDAWPFTKLPQPQAGILAIIVTLLLDVICVNVLGSYGTVNPTFSTAAGGTGWVAIAEIVLIGFYGYGVLSNNMDHWPWKDMGIQQPYIGIIEVFTGTAITGILYLLLIYPTLANYATKVTPLMPLPTAAGWFYAVIVFWLLSALIWEHWPWSLAGSRAGRAITSFFGNFIGGTVVYYFFMYLLQNFLIPTDAQKVLGEGITAWVAQLGVILVAVALVQALCFQGWPNSGSLTSRLITRTVINFVAGLIIFYGYTRWFGFVLQEAAVTKDFGGNPLMFFDITNFVLLCYTFYLGGWPFKVRK